MALKDLTLVLFLLTLFTKTLATSETEQQEPSVDEEQPAFGILDLIVLVGLGVGAVYYFFIRKNSEEPKVSQYVIQPATVPAASSSSADKGFIAKMRNSKRRMVVFYGSQTGTAEEFASRLAKEGARYGLKGVVADPEESDMEEITKISSN